MKSRCMANASNFEENLRQTCLSSFTSYHPISVCLLRCRWVPLVLQRCLPPSIFPVSHTHVPNTQVAHKDVWPLKNFALPAFYNVKYCSAALVAWNRTYARHIKSRLRLAPHIFFPLKTAWQTCACKTRAVSVKSCRSVRVPPGVAGTRVG